MSDFEDSLAALGGILLLVVVGIAFCKAMGWA